MENCFNIVHYFIYKAHYKLTLLFNKINPFRLITKLPFLRRRYEQSGIDIDEVVNNVFGDPKTGFSIMIAGGGIIGIVFLLMMTVIDFFMRLFNLHVKLTIVHFLVVGALSVIPCYLFVFKGDKYLDYFKKYENWSKSENIKYEWNSLVFILSVFPLYLFSLTTLPKQ